MRYLADFIKALRVNGFVVMDTETTGLDRGEIVDICILNRVGDVLLDTLVKPKFPIPDEATKIHGIDNDMVADAPTWPELADKVKSILFRQNVVTYNAVYDRKMLHQTAERWQMQPVIWKEEAAFFCAMEAYAIYHGDFNAYRGTYTWQKLVNAFAHVSEFEVIAHRAKADSIMALGVTEYLLRLDPSAYETDETENPSDESDL